MKIFQLIILFGLVVSADSSVRAIGKFLTSALSFGLDIYGFVDSFFDKNPPADDSLQEKLLMAISDKIDASGKYIVAELDLHTHFDRLLEHNKFMSALLIDLLNVINSTTEVAREENIRRFKEAFIAHEAEIQYIVRLLTDSIPVNDMRKPLIDVFAEDVDCSLTRLQQFREYYMNLVSTSFAIDLANERFTVDLSNQTIAFWKKHMEDLSEQFEKAKNECIDHFYELIKDDLEGDETATDLQRRNTLRYSDKLNSVIYADSDTDCRIKYLEPDIFSYTTSGNSKIVLFERKYENNETLDHNTTEVEQNCTKTFPTELDISRLRDKIEDNCDTNKTCDAIDDMFFWRGHTLRFRLVMDDQPENEIAIDQNSRTTLVRVCGKIIIIAVDELKTGNATHTVYKTISTTSSAAKEASNMAFIACLIVSVMLY